MYQPQINPITEQQYYAGSWKDIAELCKTLNISIGSGKAQKISVDVVHMYMQQAQDLINGSLHQYYYLPIQPYHQVMPNGKTKAIFPGRLRVAAQQLAAGLMLQSQFQDLDQNQNSAVEKYIQWGKRQLHACCLFNQRLPGQHYKSGWGKTAPPTMIPGIPPQQLF